MNLGHLALHEPAAALTASACLFSVLVCGCCSAAVSFVYRSGSLLYADGSPFYGLGFNAFWMPATVSFGPDFVGRTDAVLDGAQVCCRFGLRVTALLPPSLHTYAGGNRHARRLPQQQCTRVLHHVCVHLLLCSDLA